jgi:spore coat protein CotH
MGVQEDRKLVAQFDKDGDARLNATERKAAREFLAREKAEGRAPRRPGPPGRRNENTTPPEPGPRLAPADVKTFPNAPLYDLKTLRTIFLEFENADWEKELADFYHSDVEVPAKLTVDGKIYRDVGVHFRGASSFFTVDEGRKRSLNLSLDFAHEDQRLAGYRTLDLLNSHGDPTYLRAVLYSQIAGGYIPTPKANYVRVVINGESWGVYVNAQHFNKDFTKEAFGSAKGARWKVPGSPRANGGLKYIGEDVAEYKKHYEIKSKDDPKSWADLIKLCRVLNETPSNKLEQALAPLLDIDGALKFLALENVFINNDGYWVRTSDYNLYEDEDGRFHVVAHDVNETFGMPGGPGGPRGPGGPGAPGDPGSPGDPGVRNNPRVKGVELDPMTGADDPNKPLLNKLLAVPALKARYLGYVRDIAERWLDWNEIGLLAEQYQSLIAADVKTDTRKLDSFEAFTKGVKEDTEEEAGRGPRRRISLKSFVEQRRTYLLR